MRIKIVLLCMSLGCAGYAADDTPAWLKDLTGASLPQYEAKVNAVVLFDPRPTVPR